MKGRSPSVQEKEFHDLLCRNVGCIACRLEGNSTTYVSVHHIDGRTKPNAHWEVLPLCAGHHQDGYGRPGMIAIHPWKARFEKQYGKQKDLLALCIKILSEGGFAVPSPAMRYAA